MANGKRTVLIVDDEEVALSLFQEILEEEGYQTLTAKSGDEALQRAALNLPDVIIMDVMMPGMSGFETAKILKTSSHTRLIPIVLVTGMDDRASRLSGTSQQTKSRLVSTQPLKRPRFDGVFVSDGRSPETSANVRGGKKTFEYSTSADRTKRSENVTRSASVLEHWRLRAGI